jgi:predicted esterase
MLSLLLTLLACDESNSVAPAEDTVKDGPIDVGPLELLLSGGDPIPVELERLDDYEAALWHRYRQEQSQDPIRLAEHELRSITQASKTMRYSVEIIGDRPADGYPLYLALHGGGGTSASVNDEQWQQMQSYYRDSITAGAYVVPRGITNEWNLHFDATAYAMYDRLIENLILFEGVDPDRVYLLGFSAGGDGVYQIAPRMADRFAAVSMSAGHDNGVSPTNLYRLPILLQMGELDEAYSRNKAVVEFSQKIDALSSAHPEGYTHDLFLHHDGGHNAPWSDHDPTGKPYTIIRSPDAWLANGDRSTALQNSNAVSWLSRHIRTAQPDRVIWERSTAAPGRHDAWYWVEATSGDRIDVEIDRRGNSVQIHSAGDHLRLLLSHRLIDLRRPITIIDGEDALVVQPELDLRNMAQTLSSRGDPSMIFPVVIELERVAGRWTQR